MLQPETFEFGLYFSSSSNMPALYDKTIKHFCFTDLLVSLKLAQLLLVFDCIWESLSGLLQNPSIYKVFTITKLQLQKVRIYYKKCKPKIDTIHTQVL